VSYLNGRSQLPHDFGLREFHPAPYKSYGLRNSEGSLRLISIQLLQDLMNWNVLDPPRRILALDLPSVTFNLCTPHLNASNLQHLEIFLSVSSRSLEPLLLLIFGFDFYPNLEYLKHFKGYDIRTFSYEPCNFGSHLRFWKRCPSWDFVNEIWPWPFCVFQRTYWSSPSTFYTQPSGLTNLTQVLSALTPCTQLTFRWFPFNT
jgi:hypothetical protein